MKMTMHIDEGLLARVMKWTGAASKTEAVAMALREMDRKARLAEFGRVGLGFTSSELKASVEPGYDVLSMRVAETPDAAGKARKKRK